MTEYVLTVRFNCDEQATTAAIRALIMNTLPFMVDNVDMSLALAADPDLERLLQEEANIDYCTRMGHYSLHQNLESTQAQLRKVLTDLDTINEHATAIYRLANS